ncbi:hypothetical protein BDW42DRAFT_173624 [Aspergillus taichungensis]|uniref:Uncharacterized protein n=1 Tax=Aspergillus taichungensis TaxID=482145 RepID=A0A2J5HPH4_9EURO|nr:hypothetical protein BDW42DRAFT_173624 [Aspergillus taichungensis]
MVLLLPFSLSTSTGFNLPNNGHIPFESSFQFPMSPPLLCMSFPERIASHCIASHLIASRQPQPVIDRPHTPSVILHAGNLTGNDQL